jgi:hypothetical protein
MVLAGRYWLLLFLIVSVQGVAQDEMSRASDDSRRFAIHRDTSIRSVSDYFRAGMVSGHIRNHTMGTVNRGGLHDYYSNAIGGAVKYTTGEWKGIQLGVKGIFTYQLFGSDLTALDPEVGKSAAWEKELYDVLRPDELTGLNRVEELFVKFNIGNSFVQYGKININKGPLLKQRDGRMMPFVYRGFWSEIAEFRDQRVTLGLINGVSPRGMTEWFDLNEAIGLISRGFLPDGSASHYHERSGINMLGVLGYEKNVRGLKMQVWNYLFGDKSDMVWLQADYQKNKFKVGAQFVHQRALPAVQEVDYDERYIQDGEQANVLSCRVGVADKVKGFDLSAAYLHSFDDGRFLFPRELGREDFYVSQPRSWIDGFGNTDVYMLRFIYNKKNATGAYWNIDTRVSRIETPGLDNFELNKYSIPSYYQLTFFPRYHFSGVLKGMDVGMLYILKYTERSVELPPQNTFYRTDLHHFNLIMNIEF